MAKKKKNKKRRHLSNFGATVLSIFSIISLTALIVVGYVVVNIVTVTNGDPVINLESAKNNQNQTSFLYATDSDGNEIELLRLHGTENRIWVDLNDIPQNMRDAFIALEDKRFNDHKGVDWKRTIGVMIVSKYEGQGGSTITQQLVKNVTGNNEVTFVRKYNEILTALNLEKNYSKDQILEAYLNTLYLGQGCYGVETASETYFGKTVGELNYAECAVIAAITQKPYSLDPIKNPEENRLRQIYCLDEMLSQGKITEEQYYEAVNYDLIFTTDDDYVPSAAEIERQKNKKEATNNKEVQSFYVDYVIDDVIDDLQKELGCSTREATNMIYGGGLKIYTAVDLDVQKKVEKIYVNKTNWLDKKAQSAITIMDYSGRVVAIVGQAGEKEGNRVLNRATDSPRPPGSTIKPLSSYAPGIELGEITWSTYVRDSSITYNGRLWPKNYSGNHGSGSNTTVQVALAKSLNTVPARICVNMISTDVAYDYVKNKFHISTTVDGEDNNPAPLVVGSMNVGITSLDMTAAYASFGNGGLYYEPYSYFYVENSLGEVILDNRDNTGEQIISPETAEVMRHMMETVTTASYGTGYNYKTKGFDNFAKTGTTDNNYDKWMVGGTPYYVAAVWYGYDIPKTIHTSGNPAGTIYKTVMDEVHEGLAEKEFEDNSELVKKYYCTSTGKLASSNCSSRAAGWYIEEHLPSYCSGHYSSKPDNDSGSDNNHSDSDDEPATPDTPEVPAEPSGDTTPGAAENTQ
ncbi:MAG: transglycosylase domain-containing protein [Acutalibacteraceae bacterium]|nr:transglycosylase domain-containing protein [Acutalibacteraceae bacterium]